MKTKELLLVPVGSWNQTHVSRARFLIQQWTENEASDAERALQQSKILRRWMQERTPSQDTDNATLIQIMRENLHRCLNSWRTLHPQKGHPMNARREALDLVRLFREVGGGYGPTAKTYSMCLNVLGQYPEAQSGCTDIMSIYNEYNAKDLQFYNVCLGAMAKASAYHKEAPLLAEDIFQDLLSVNDLSPDSASLAALLHAWANGSNLHEDAAQRSQAILDQMLLEHLELVNTICFNIVIDAWAKQGSHENAETNLRRMQTLYRKLRDDRIRPNEVTFNSAIHACAKGRKPEHAEILLEQMLQLGYDPTKETFAVMMKAMLHNENPGPKVQAFLDTLEERHAKGEIPLAPQKVHYLMAIQAWGRTRADALRIREEESPPEKSEHLLQRMKVLSSRNSSRSDLDPCVMAYTALIDNWAESGQDDAPHHAWRIFQEMQQTSSSTLKVNVAPNEVTLNVLVKAFCRHGRIQEARRLLSRFHEDPSIGLEPYHTMLRICADSHDSNMANKALEILHDLELVGLCQGQERLKPTAHTYLLVLLALGNSSGHDAAQQAEDLFWMMLNGVDGSVKPSVKHMNCVLRAWSKSLQGGAAERAERFLDRVRNEDTFGNCQPNAISHLHMIYAWAKSGRRIASHKASTHLDTIKRLCKEESVSKVMEKALLAVRRLQT
jgi:pentatricopeptide repeat protein